MRRFVSKQRVVLYLLFMLLLTTSCNQKLDEVIQAYQEMPPYWDDIGSELVHNC